ncbi:Soluble lytic murein transglycosylase precursor [Anaerovibrio sp. JC8]|uniref:lytic transglycosylase domain-containing protein n=1 Tax=Anaerovibrio sp. JC8 TaxID=1240085 RepID=UPI000A096FBF|nr:lytic transglycosylase domain-containing protein [Anaerovibrio sp. JC8]ORT99772.1 Soluble lytic murein transglycosylase precursor [Anaerovibrio sp. JC8]
MDREDERLKRRREYLRQKKEFQRRTWSCAIGIIILLMAFVVFFVTQQKSVQQTFMFPYHYRQIVQVCSQEHGVDEFLVAAVIKNESNFKDKAVSTPGAIGLMQLMPDTAKWIAGEINDESYSPEMLEAPEMNIYYGSWYLGRLLKDFHGNKILALAAYNAGHGNVEEWMKEYGWDYDFNDISAIPFRETEMYVKSVLKTEKKYIQLYGESE